MQWKLTKRLTGSSPKVSEVCREFTKGDRELAMKALGVRWKKTMRLVGRSSEVDIERGQLKRLRWYRS
ncbi:hypothetical protein GW17_00043470 [Ensete ventricosum]|nr:hypothetical protein GW17_00043470 [Ensete ventricosum]